jgi:hypothetical protein
VDDAERRVAVLDRIDQDADAHQVVDVVEADIPGDHLLVDRVVVLGTAGDLLVDLGLAQVGADVLDTSCRNASRRGARLDTRRTISSNRLGYRVAKARSSSSHFTVFMPRRWASGAKISRVSLDLRSCFSRDQVAQRPHVVQPVGELDHQDTDVAGHRDHHLADGLRFGGLAVLDLV